MSTSIHAPICVMAAINSAKRSATHLSSDLNALAGLHGTMMRASIRCHRPAAREQALIDLKTNSGKLIEKCRAMSDRLLAEAETASQADAPNVSRKAANLRLVARLLLAATDLLEQEILECCEHWTASEGD